MTSTQDQASAKPKLSIVQHVFAAWPIALVAVGGAIGGLCGGVAWAINYKIMTSSMAAPVRYGLCVLTGLVAIAVWLLAVFLIVGAFPGVFG